MKFRTFALGALVAAGAVMATVETASARIVCNRYGDCWRTSRAMTIDPPEACASMTTTGAGAIGERYRWRDARPGRGYWGRGGVWITF